MRGFRAPEVHGAQLIAGEVGQCCHVARARHVAGYALSTQDARSFVKELCSSASPTSILYAAAYQSYWTLVVSFRQGAETLSRSEAASCPITCNSEISRPH